MKKGQVRLEDLPIYEITLEEDGNQGIRMVSLVKDPAIEVKGMYFSTEELEKEKTYQFKTVDDKQIVVGPAMIPNKKILRRDENDNMYYVVFKPETIKMMVDKFNKENNNKSINVDHSNKMVDAFIQQNWIVEDPTYDKSRYYGFNNIPVGSWFIEVKIEDANFWNSDIKDEGKYGFSIEGLMGQQLLEMSNDFNKFIDSLTDEEIYEIFTFTSDLSPDNPDSRWHTHPNCKCSYSKGTWNYIYDGEYPCDTCKEVGSRYERVWSSGMPGKGSFSMTKTKISFDYDGTLSTDKGKKMAAEFIANGDNVYIVTKRATDNEVMAVAKELGIRDSNVIFTNHAPKWKKLMSLGIDVHYDNKQDEIDEINSKTKTKAIKI